MSRTQRTELLYQLEKRARKEKNNAVKFALLQELADSSLANGELERAFQAYKHALSSAQKMHESMLECETLMDLGATANELGETVNAIGFYKDALKIARAKRYFRIQNRILGKLGLISVQSHDPALAARYFEEATDAARLNKSIVSEEQALIDFENRISDRVDSYSADQTLEAMSSQIKKVEHLRIAQTVLITTVGTLMIVVFFILLNQYLSPILALVALLIGSLLFISYGRR